MNGRRCVRSITSPSNATSVAFHCGLGFEMLRGDVVIDGVPVWFDYAGTGGHRVVFRREINVAYAPERGVGPRGRDALERILAS